MAISDNLRGAIYINVAMAAFTLNDAAMKVATLNVPLFEAITLRGVLTLLVLGGMGLAAGLHRMRLSGREWRLLGVRTLAEVGGTVTFLTALLHMPLANLSAIMQSLPLAVTLAAALVFGDRIGWRRLLAIAVGFCGVLLIIRPGTDGFDRWAVLGLVSVACVVVRDLATRELPRSVPSVAVAVAASAGVTVMGLAGSLAEGWQPVTWHDAGIIAAAAAALIVGYMFVVMMMRVGDIGFIAPFRYTALIWAVALGWLVFGTWPDLATLAGSGIVIATGIFTLYRERVVSQRLKRAAPVPGS